MREKGDVEGYAVERREAYEFKGAPVVSWEA